MLFFLQVEKKGGVEKELLCWTPSVNPSLLVLLLRPPAIKYESVATHLNHLLLDMELPQVTPSFFPRTFPWGIKLPGCACRHTHPATPRVCQPCVPMGHSACTDLEMEQIQAFCLHLRHPFLFQGPCTSSSCASLDMARGPERSLCSDELHIVDQLNYCPQVSNCRDKKNERLLTWLTLSSAERSSGKA